MTALNKSEFLYTDLRLAWPESAWLQALCEQAEQRLEQHEHGDLPRWRAALEALPDLAVSMQADQSEPSFGAPAEDQPALAETLMQLHPWRKGPLCLGGCHIDTEWRSDWKWNRLARQVQWQDTRVLDIGCGNGYFGWRMLAAGARLVVGVDPTLVFVMQWLACRHFAGPQPNFVLPLGIEDLPGLGASETDPTVTTDKDLAGMDVVCSMGVLYHRRDHIEHLQQLRQLMRPGGQLVLETLVLPQAQASEILIPEERYARMRNVWAVPGTEVLQHWVAEAGFE
ncbi:MAG TPA: tRNA 5-methoxyuridine(34)/uridine 5-oxyacetic acid(34) synthase CmoB, partial [Xanthomonadales bacterium]|nr:tRNA 5-methoxyuridine(34)/uridine 5-oxyacetic acid(34) synthase CmoB [Xanthomonadales bacterium]